MPITWGLSGALPDLAPGAPLILGTFTYDADAALMLNWQLAIQRAAPPLILAGPSVICPEPGICDVNSFSAAPGGRLIFSHQNPAVFDSVVLLPTAPLTDAGGILPLVNGTSSGSGSVLAVVATAGPPHFFALVNGTISAAPEPGTAVYMLLFAVTAAALRGRAVNQ